MNGPGSLTGKWQAGDGKPHKFIQAWDSRDEAVSYLLERHKERSRESAIDKLPARLRGAQYLWFTKLDNGQWSCIYAHPDDLAKRDGNYPECTADTMEEAASAMLQQVTA